MMLEVLERKIELYQQHPLAELFEDNTKALYDEWLVFKNSTMRSIDYHNCTCDGLNFIFYVHIDSGSLNKLRLEDCDY